MKIAIFGAGAVGGYFGGRLAQAGHDVTFIARGKHLEAIKTNGLLVQSLHGDFSISPAKATDQPETIGTVDVVLCCVKSWQVSEIVQPLRSLLAQDTVIIPLQNGVEAHTKLSLELDRGRILPGVCRLISMIDAPGCIRHAGADPYITFGEMDGRLSRRAEEVARVLSGAKGFTVDVAKDIFSELWKKFMLIASWSGVGAVTRSPIGIFRSLPETRALLMNSIREIYDVARANGVALEETELAAIIGFIDKLPPDGTASMQRDIMAGRPSELDEQSGAVVRFGQKGGVATPVNQFIYSSLLPQERKARGEMAF